MSSLKLNTMRLMWSIAVLLSYLAVSRASAGEYLGVLTLRPIHIEPLLHMEFSGYIERLLCTDKKRICSDAPDRGMAYARIPQLFYNLTKNSCEEFEFGGVGAPENSNRFDRCDECIESCGNETTSCEEIYPKS